MRSEPAPDQLAPIRQAARRCDLTTAARLAERAVRAVTPGSPAALELANLRGAVAFEQGRLDQAESCFEEAIRLASAFGDGGLVARASNNLASIAHLRGKDTLAVSLYRSALEAYRRLGDAGGEAQTGHNLGLVQRDRGLLGDARLLAEAAVQAARRTGDRALLSLVLMGRAETALEDGRRLAARRDLRQARSLARAAGDRLGLVEARRLEACFALSAHRYAEALREASRGYLLARRLGSVQLSGECAELSARASQCLARPRLAERYRRTARDCYRALGAVVALRRIDASSAA